MAFSEQPRRTASGERAKGPVVLLVEDVYEVRVALAEVLVRAGFGVVEAANGREAVVYANTVHPDVIVMDLSLPVLDGAGATRLLRADPLTQGIPIIALTGYPVEPADRKEFDHVLAKPCLPDALLLRSRSVLRSAGSEARG
jgi:CheY-like chemotaxis protein